MFVGIEYGFLALGVYKLVWWHPLYTGAALPVYFWIARKWHGFVLQGSSRFVRWFTLVGISYILYADLETIPFFGGQYLFAAGWFSNPDRDTVAVLVVYTTVRAVIIGTVSFYRLHWGIVAAVIATLWTGYLVSMQMDVLLFRSLWSFCLFAAYDIVVLIACRWFNRVLSR